MATPPGPASPGNPISYNDIIAESNFAPPAGNNGIYDFATYIYDDGFINDYTFYPAFYPLPSSPAGGAVTQNASISMFYDIDSFTGIDINFQSGTPGWVTTIDVTFNDATVLGSGSNSGPNSDSQEQFNGVVYGTQGGSIPHWYQIDLQVNLNAGAPPFTPAVNVDYDTGAGFTAFPGSPTTMAGLLTTGPINNVANGGIVYIRVS
jgi:hypothetical protein